MPLVFYLRAGPTTITLHETASGKTVISGLSRACGDSAVEIVQPMLILDRLLAWVVATSDNGHKFFRPVPRHRPVRDTIDLKLWLKFRQGLRILLRTGSQKLS